MGKTPPRIRIGQRISVEGIDHIHRGKIVSLKGGEARIRWNGGQMSWIDRLDLLQPNGAHFEQNLR